MIRLNETKFCIHIFIDKNYSMYVGIVKCGFSQICNRVTALDLCQNLVFAQYRENKKTKRMRPNYVYTLSLTRSTLGL